MRLAAVTLVSVSYTSTGSNRVFLLVLQGHCWVTVMVEYCNSRCMHSILINILDMIAEIAIGASM